MSDIDVFATRQINRNVRSLSVLAVELQRDVDHQQGQNEIVLAILRALGQVFTGRGTSEHSDALAMLQRHAGEHPWATAQALRIAAEALEAQADAM